MSFLYRAIAFDRIPWLKLEIVRKRLKPCFTATFVDRSKYSSIKLLHRWISQSVKLFLNTYLVDERWGDVDDE